MQLGVSAAFLASLMAAGGVVGYLTHVAAVERPVPMRLVSLQLTFPVPAPPTAPPSTPVVVAPKADTSRSVAKPPEHKAVLQPPVNRYASIIPTAQVNLSIIPSITLATYYASWPPSICYDSAGAHKVIPTRFFAAMRGVACGTVVIIHGAAGTVRVTIWDHGPNCSCPERDMDASFDAFVAAVGPLSRGIGPVQVQVGGG